MPVWFPSKEHEPTAWRSHTFCVQATHFYNTPNICSFIPEEFKEYNIFLPPSQTSQILKPLGFYWLGMKEKHCWFKGSQSQIFTHSVCSVLKSYTSAFLGAGWLFNCPLSSFDASNNTFTPSVWHSKCPSVWVWPVAKRQQKDWFSPWLIKLRLEKPELVWTSVFTSKVATEWKTWHGWCSVHVLRMEKSCLPHQIISSAFSAEWRHREAEWTVHRARGLLLTCRACQTLTETEGGRGVADYCVQKNRGPAWHSDEESKQKPWGHLRSVGPSVRNMKQCSAVFEEGRDLMSPRGADLIH